MAASAFIIGMDGMEILEDRDIFRNKMRATVVKVATQIQRERDQRLAEYIAEAVVKRIR